MLLDNSCERNAQLLARCTRAPRARLVPDWRCASSRCRSVACDGWNLRWIRSWPRRLDQYQHPARCWRSSGSQHDVRAVGRSAIHHVFYTSCSAFHHVLHSSGAAINILLFACRSDNLILRGLPQRSTAASALTNLPRNIQSCSADDYCVPPRCSSAERDWPLVPAPSSRLRYDASCYWRCDSHFLWCFFSSSLWLNSSGHGLFGPGPDSWRSYRHLLWPL